MTSAPSPTGEGVAASDLIRTLPRKLKIGAYDWRIKIATGDNDAWGETEALKQEITIWPEDMPSAHFCVGIVLHEILHALYSVDWLEPADTEAKEESIVAGYERGLVALFRDNPKLLTWIKRGLKPCKI